MTHSLAKATEYAVKIKTILQIFVYKLNYLNKAILVLSYFEGWMIIFYFYDLKMLFIIKKK